MEMDIYMRRRLVALAILVGIIILFILLIRSCGGDDEQAPMTPVGVSSRNIRTSMFAPHFVKRMMRNHDLCPSCKGVMKPFGYVIQVMTAAPSQNNDLFKSLRHQRSEYGIDDFFVNVLRNIDKTAICRILLIFGKKPGIRHVDS